MPKASLRGRDAFGIGEGGGDQIVGNEFALGICLCVILITIVVSDCTSKLCYLFYPNGHNILKTAVMEGKLIQK